MPPTARSPNPSGTASHEPRSPPCARRPTTGYRRSRSSTEPSATISFRLSASASGKVRLEREPLPALHQAVLEAERAQQLELVGVLEDATDHAGRGTEVLPAAVEDHLRDLVQRRRARERRREAQPARLLGSADGFFLCLLPLGVLERQPRLVGEAPDEGDEAGVGLPASRPLEHEQPVRLTGDDDGARSVVWVPVATAAS